jgi:hypothetical protein
VPESSVVMPMGFGLTGPVDIVLESSFGILLVDEVVSTPIVVSPVSWVGAFDISAASTDDGFAQGVFFGKFSDLSCFSGIYHCLAGFWWGGPGGAPYCSGEKFDSAWVLWSESCLSLFGGVEGGLAGAQGEGVYFGDRAGGLSLSADGSEGCSVLCCCYLACVLGLLVFR